MRCFWHLRKSSKPEELEKEKTLSSDLEKKREELQAPARKQQTPTDPRYGWYQPQVIQVVKGGCRNWEAQLEASKQTFEEQLQSSKQVRFAVASGVRKQFDDSPTFLEGTRRYPVGIHCVGPPLLSMLNLRSLTANVSTWRPSFKHLSRRQRSLGDQIQTSLLVVGVVVVLVVLVVLAVAVGGGGSGFDLGDALSLFPNSGKELEQESTRFSELDTRCEQLEASKFLSHDSCWEFCT